MNAYKTTGKCDLYSWNYRYQSLSKKIPVILCAFTYFICVDIYRFSLSYNTRISLYDYQRKSMLINFFNCHYTSTAIIIELNANCGQNIQANLVNINIPKISMLLLFQREINLKRGEMRFYNNAWRKYFSS